MAEIDLQLVTRQLDRLINDVASLKGDMTVVMARLDRVGANTRGAVDRIDVTCRGLLDEIRAVHSRTDRLSRRVDRLESERAE
jgi:ubiquinone biosynthesis protein UbiJ